MPSSYYTHASGKPANQTRGLASEVRYELDSIAASFALLPSPTALASGSINYALDTGLANAYVVSVSSAVTAYSDGFSFFFKPLNNNSGASTLNVNTLGLKAIVRPDGTAVQLNDIVANQILKLTYNSSYNGFQLDTDISYANQAAASASAAAASAGSAAASAAATAGAIVAERTATRALSGITTLDTTGSVSFGTTNKSNGRVSIQAGTSASGDPLFMQNLDGTNNPYLWVRQSSAGTKLYAASSSGGAASNLVLASGGVDVATVSSTGLAVTGQISNRGASGVGYTFLETSSGNTARIKLGAAAGTGYIEADAGSGSIALGLRVAGTQVATLDASGNLLIKKTALTNSVRGAYICADNGNGATVCATGDGSTSATLFVGTEESVGATRFLVLGNGNVQNYNNSYGAISDIKLKQDITDATPKLAKLLKVRIVNYKFRADPDGIKQIGVIAQELEEISPGLIEETPDFEEVEVEPARTETKVTQKQKSRFEESVRHETLLCDGQYRRIPIRTDIEVPLFEFYPLFDETGEPVLEVAEAAIEAQAEVLDEEGSVVTPAVTAKPAVMRQAMHQVPVMEDVAEIIEVPAKTERRPTGTTTKSVKYSVFVPMLIKAMQEQQAQIEELKAKVGA